MRWKEFLNAYLVSYQKNSRRKVNKFKQNVLNFYCMIRLIVSNKNVGKCEKDIFVLWKCTFNYALECEKTTWPT